MDPQPFHPGQAGLGYVECPVQGQLHEGTVLGTKRAGEFADGFEFVVELALRVSGEYASLFWPAPAQRFHSPEGTYDGSPGRQPGMLEPFAKSSAPASMKRRVSSRQVWSG